MIDALLPDVRGQRIAEVKHSGVVDVPALPMRKIILFVMANHVRRFKAGGPLQPLSYRLICAWALSASDGNQIFRKLY